MNIKYKIAEIQSWMFKVGIMKFYFIKGGERFYLSKDDTKHLKILSNGNIYIPNKILRDYNLI
jgi:hypothetical protein